MKKLSTLMQVSRKKTGQSIQVYANQLGISKGYLYDIEQGRKTPRRLDLLDAISKLYNLSSIQVYDTVTNELGCIPPDIEAMLLREIETHGPDFSQQLREWLNK